MKDDTDITTVDDPQAPAPPDDGEPPPEMDAPDAASGTFPAQAVLDYTRANLPTLQAALDRANPSSVSPTGVAPLEDQLQAPPEPQLRPHPLGSLSMVYETGYHPGQEDLAAGKISSGHNDPKGGVSYGAYQLSSLQHQPEAFLAQEGAPWASQFAGLTDVTDPNGKFAGAWKAIAQSNPDAFFNAQHEFIKHADFDPTVAAVQKQTGLDLNNRSDAVRDVVWSMAVNHHAAPQLVTQAVNGLRGQISPSDPDYDKALINKLYDVRDAYVGKIGLANLTKRYQSERQAALTMLGN